MSLYVDNLTTQPSVIGFNNKDVKSVYFNDSFVWGEEEPWDYTDLLDTIQKKKDGIITKWPSKYSVGEKFVVPLTSASDFWGSSVVMTISKQNQNSLICRVDGASCKWFDNTDIYNYKGWINSIPRGHCQELATILPFGDNLVEKVDYYSPAFNKVSSLNSVNNTLTGSTYKATVRDKVFVASFETAPEYGLWDKSEKAYSSGMYLFDPDFYKWVQASSLNDVIYFSAAYYSSNGNYGKDIVFSNNKAIYYPQLPFTAYFEIG